MTFTTPWRCRRDSRWRWERPPRRTEIERVRGEPDPRSEPPLSCSAGLRTVAIEKNGPGVAGVPSVPSPVAAGGGWRPPPRARRGLWVGGGGGGGGGGGAGVRRGGRLLSRLGAAG